MLSDLLLLRHAFFKRKSSLIRPGSEINVVLPWSVGCMNEQKGGLPHEPRLQLGGAGFQLGAPAWSPDDAHQNPYH